MGTKPKGKMPVIERAKQFMPFAAVRGLQLALRRKEQELVQVLPKIMQRRLPLSWMLSCVNFIKAGQCL